MSNLVLNSGNSTQAEESDSDDSNDGDTNISTERSITPTSNSEMESAKDDMISETTGQLKYRKRKKTEEKVDDAELEIMKTISSRLEKKSEEKAKKEQDEDVLFCQLLATQLRQLPSRDKLKVKMQINNIIYNHLIVPTETTTIASPFQATIQTPLSNVMPHDICSGRNISGTQFHIPPENDLGEPGNILHLDTFSTIIPEKFICICTKSLFFKQH